MNTEFKLTDEEKRHVEIIEKLNELVNTEQYDKMNELFADNYVDHNPGWKIESIEDLKKLIADGHKNFNVHNEIKKIIPSNDMLFVEINNHGEHKTQMFGCPATGKKTNMTTFEIYRFENNKIAERWVLSDIIGLMKQIGVKMPVSI